MLTAIVFDLDDTLYLERDYVRSGFGAVAAWVAPRTGLPVAEAFRQLWSLFETGVRRGTFDRWLLTQGLPTEPWVCDMVRVYREHEPRMLPDPGVTALLGRLRPRYRLGLLTDGDRAIQRAKVAALGVGHHFDAIVFSDDEGAEAWKPSPRPFRTLVDRMGIDATEAVYVADNPLKDFLGARRAGLASVRVRHADGLYRDVEPPSAEHAPEAEIASLDFLETTLGTLRRCGNDDVRD